MIPTDRAKTMGEREIKDNTHPQFIGHAELFHWQARQFPELEKSGGWQHQAPDLLEVQIPPLERFNHATDIHIPGVLRDGDRLTVRRNGTGTAHSLPANGISFHLEEDGAQHLGYQ